jgi:hypothetical protein
MRMWTGERPKEVGESAGAASENVLLSDAGRAAQASEGTALGEIARDGQDARLSLIRFLLARLTGKEVEVFDAGRMGGGAASPSSSPRDDFGIEYDRHESHTEAEQMNFSARGVVQTADGRSIDFELSMSMERYHHEESDVSLRLGNAAQTCDPLVINFSGNAAQLTDQRFSFDLNSDGNASERINFLGSGSGFLAFDRNGDGTINNGSELFGTRTGNGFAELAAFDDDGNGWIDENDEAFAHLSVWIKNGMGSDVLYSLEEMGVGAISLTSVASPFSIKDANNDLQGQVRASGFYLKENGGVGSLQQIDLTV